MAWTKTEAGRREMQTRSLVSARTQRNLLVLIDGKASVQALCEKVTGASEADFEALREAGLIEFAGGAASTTAPRGASPVTAASAAPMPSLARTPVAPSPLPGAEPSYAHLSSTLTRLVSTELGLRGLPLTLAVEKARTIEDLRRVADTVVARIRERRGEAHAAAALEALSGS